MKREAICHIRAKFTISYSRACKIIGYCRTNQYYKKIMPQKDNVLKAIISGVIGTSRKGREKVIRLVQAKHPQISHSKIRRVYTREGFSLFKRLKKRVKNNPANPIEVPLAPNKEWAIDFMSDSLTNGRRFRTLNVIEQYNRSCLGITPAFSIPARKVTEVLNRLIQTHGKPERIRTDNGPEFTSKAFQLWLENNKIKWAPIQKGKPQQNAIVERFNRTYREDVLDASLFDSIQMVDKITQDWIDDYNAVRPHQALNYMTPLQYGT